jgi:hypothetical protein
MLRTVIWHGNHITVAINLETLPERSKVMYNRENAKIRLKIMINIINIAGNTLGVLEAL